MRIFLLLIVGLYLMVPSLAPAAPAADIAQAPNCRLCGMDREKFSHSRMVIEYEDGTAVATCSLHCSAVELANTIDRMPVTLKIADYNSKELKDSEKAVWVLGGSKKGVMTAQAKWAFGDRSAAEQFIKANGGAIISFDEAIKATYDDMYQDTKMIREFRKLKRLNQPRDTAARP